MRDVDEQWVAGLVARSRGVVPEVPVDVAAALRGGRRRRTQRRAVGGGAVLAVAAGAVFGLPALPRPTTVPGVVETATAAPTDDPRYAEIVDASVMCADDAWLEGRAENRERPRSGAIPPGFAPVAVVRCWEPRSDPRFDMYYPPRNVRREGDLGPLLALLADPPVFESPASHGCTAVGDLMYDVYLVDAGHRALRPVWPTDECGHPLQEGWTLLEALNEVAPY